MRKTFFDLAPDLPPEFLVVGVQAPILLAPGQYAWFPLDWSSGIPIAKPEEIEVGREQMQQIIEDVLSRYVVDRSRVFLLGFSQGAILSLSVAVSTPQLVRGVVALSGRFPHEIHPEITSHTDRSRLQIWIGHGQLDPVIPIATARTSYERLEAGGITLEYHEYPIRHSISLEETRDILTWLRSTAEI